MRIERWVPLYIRNGRNLLEQLNKNYIYFPLTEVRMCAHARPAHHLDA